MPNPRVSCARSNVSTVSVNSEFIQDTWSGGHMARILRILSDLAAHPVHRCGAGANTSQASLWGPRSSLSRTQRKRVVPFDPDVPSGRQRETAKIQAEMKAVSCNDASRSSCRIVFRQFAFSRSFSICQLCSSTRCSAFACKLLRRPSFAKWSVDAS